MSINQKAPPAEVKAQANFFRFEPLPKSDTYIFTVVAYNYLDSAPFTRTDQATKKQTIINGPGVELFLGTVVNGKSYFVKTWPIFYSINERSNYTKWYKALTGTLPTVKQNPDDLLGKAIMLPVELTEKVSKKGTKYMATRTGNPSPVPSMLAATVTPLATLKGPFDAAVKASEQKGDAGEQDGGNDPF